MVETSKAFPLESTRRSFWQQPSVFAVRPPLRTFTVPSLINTKAHIQVEPDTDDKSQVANVYIPYTTLPTIYLLPPCSPYSPSPSLIRLPSSFHSQVQASLALPCDIYAPHHPSQAQRYHAHTMHCINHSTYACPSSHTIRPRPFPTKKRQYHNIPPITTQTPFRSSFFLPLPCIPSYSILRLSSRIRCTMYNTPHLIE